MRISREKKKKKKEKTLGVNRRISPLAVERGAITACSERERKTDLDLRREWG